MDEAQQRLAHVGVLGGTSLALAIYAGTEWKRAAGVAAAALAGAALTRFVDVVRERRDSVERVRTEELRGLDEARRVMMLVKGNLNKPQKTSVRAGNARRRPASPPRHTAHHRAGEGADEVEGQGYGFINSAERALVGSTLNKNSVSIDPARDRTSPARRCATAMRRTTPATSTRPPTALVFRCAFTLPVTRPERDRFLASGRRRRQLAG